MRIIESVADNFIASDAAETKIVDTAKVLLGDSTATKDEVYQIYAQKLISDVLDYCHREDFPAALVYTYADLLVKLVNDVQDETRGLKSVKMDGTQFDFANSDGLIRLTG